MQLEVGMTYIDPRYDSQVLINNRNHITGLYDSDTGTTFKPNGEWAGGGYFLEELEFPVNEDNGFTFTDQYVKILEAIVGNEAVMKIKEAMK